MAVLFMQMKLSEQMGQMACVVPLLPVPGLAQGSPYYAMRARYLPVFSPPVFSAANPLMLGDGCHFVSYPLPHKNRSIVFCASAEALHTEWEADMLAEHPLLKYLYAAKPHWAKLPLYRDDSIASWRRMGSR